MKKYISNSIVILFEVVLVFIILILFYKINLYNKTLFETTEQRVQMILIADKLRQSSDNLTHFARTYVSTGNLQFKEQYFTTLDIRNGLKPRPFSYKSIYWDLDKDTRALRHPDTIKISLKELIRQLPFTKEEIKELTLSEAQSNDLVKLETEAFKAMSQNKPNQKLAIKLLHSKQYSLAKHKIINPIDNFITMLDKRTKKEVQNIEEKITTAFLLLTLSIVIFIIGNIISYRLISGKDNEYAKKLKNNMNIISKHVMYSKTDLKGRIVEVSDKFCDISGYTRDELLGKSHNIMRHPDMPAATFKTMWKQIKSKNTWNGEIKNLRKDGTYYWVYSNITPEYDLSGNVIGYMAIRDDITDKKRIEQLSITDGLTSLYNRRHFDTILPQQIAINKREKGLLAFVLVDIDHFKQYNDTYGHQEGDRALKLVAKSLSNTLKRSNDYVFRLGGEEFGLIYNIKHKEDALSMANKAKQNIENMKIKHTKNSASKFITISSGLYVINANDNSTIDDIYKKTDSALYASKQNGRNQVTLA